MPRTALIGALAALTIGLTSAPAFAVTDVTMTLTAIDVESPTIGQEYGFGGSLSSDDPVPTGAPIHISRHDSQGDSALPDALTDTGGSFTVSDTADHAGLQTYTATYDGDETHGGATAQVSTTVQRAASALTFLTRTGPYPYGTTVGALVHFDGGAGKVVRFRQDDVTGHRSLGPVVTDSSGNAKVNLTLLRRTVVTAVFAGDGDLAASQTHGVLTARAVLHDTAIAPYGRSGSFNLYHAPDKPAIRAVLYPTHPNRDGKCLHFTVEQYFSPKPKVAPTWQVVGANRCIRLGQGEVTATLIGQQKAGDLFRIRSEWTGDIHNAAVVGPWVNLRITA
jgi:hypothetical protein